MSDRSQKQAPKGYVPIRALCVELAAGGVERDNIEYVRIGLISSNLTELLFDLVQEEVRS